MSRQAQLQAFLLLAVLSGDGFLAYTLGAPWWLVPLYAALGAATATGRLWLDRRARRPVADPAPRPVADPAPEATPAPEPAVRARRALGYVCVGDQADGGLLSAAGRSIAEGCSVRDLQLVTIVHDVVAPGADHARPLLAWALERIAGGHADALVVAHLRDLSSNMASLSSLLSWFNDRGRTLIAVDLQLDTSTEAGRLAALAVASIGGWGHERISERTRRDLEAARSGRTAVADLPELQERIAAMREGGMTLEAIADTLNAEGVPTLRGGAKWRPSSVQRATGYRRPSSRRRVEPSKPQPGDASGRQNSDASARRLDFRP